MLACYARYLCSVWGKNKANQQALQRDTASEGAASVPDGGNPSAEEVASPAGRMTMQLAVCARMPSDSSQSAQTQDRFLLSYLIPE